MACTHVESDVPNWWELPSRSLCSWRLDARICRTSQERKLIGFGRAREVDGGQPGRGRTEGPDPIDESPAKCPAEDSKTP